MDYDAEFITCKGKKFNHTFHLVGNNWHYITERIECPSLWSLPIGLPWLEQGEFLKEVRLFDYYGNAVWTLKLVDLYEIDLQQNKFIKCILERQEFQPSRFRLDSFSENDLISNVSICIQREKLEKSIGVVDTQLLLDFYVVGAAKD